MFQILVLNPGSTSTKIAVFKDDNCLWKENITHPLAEIRQFKTIVDQVEYRRKALFDTIREKGCSLSEISAIVARGGLLKPLAGGVYLIDRDMYDDLASGKYGEHASNLGGVIAFQLARELGIPAYTVDPVSVDEFEDEARFSGLPELPRKSQAHALNMKAVARKVAESLGKPYNEVNLITAHLGSGISVAPHRRGRMVDVNNANNEGPFSLERCGTLPVLGLAALCYSGNYTHQEMTDLLTKKGGIYSYLGTKNFREVEDLVARGNVAARRVVEAMCYQVAKEIGGMAAVLAGEVDRIVLTGGMAFSSLVTGAISLKVSFIAPVVVVPGEEEMEALALGALRVLQGREEAKIYGDAGGCGQ